MSQLDDCPANGLQPWLSCLVQQPIRETFLSAAQDMTAIFSHQSSNTDSEVEQNAEVQMASMHKAAAHILLAYERTPRMQSPATMDSSPQPAPATTQPSPKCTLLSTTTPSAATLVEETNPKAEVSTPLSFTKSLAPVETYKLRLQDARSGRKRGLANGGEISSSGTKRVKHAELPKDNHIHRPPSITSASGPPTPNGTSIALPSATNSNATHEANGPNAATLRKVRSLNLSGKGPWSASASVPCHGNPCVAKLHICKKYWNGVKESGDSSACEHGGDRVEHWDSASQVTWVHVRPTCMFEMRDLKHQCQRPCVWAHRRDGSAEAWKVRMAKAEEWLHIKKRYPR